MSIKIRVTLLLSLLVLGFGAALGVVRWLEHRAFERRVAADRDRRALLLNHWIEATNKTLPDFAESAAESKRLVAILTAADANQARSEISASVARAELAGLWVIDGDGKTRFEAGTIGAPPLAPGQLAALAADAPSRQFFTVVGEWLMEVCVRRLTAAGADSRAFVVVARIWDQAHLRRLAELTEGLVSLLPPRPPVAEEVAGRLVVERPLADWQGRPVRLLRVEYPLVNAVANEAVQTRVFFVFGLLVLFAMVLAIEGWVLRPLRRIGESLATDNPAVVEPLSGEPSELGRVARLVQASFAQRVALEQEIAERKRTQTALEKSEDELRRTMEERARLGRDLHDGVIQTLYAAGMGLTGVRALLTTEQIEAATRLEQTRAALNETIHDVRNFIVGLEPEALKTQTFTQAVHALLEILQASGPLQAEVVIDETIANRLTLAQRVHGLQIVREAVSNAVRHGNATKVRITLQLAGHFAEFAIGDNGSGFNVASAGGGHGLANFAQRARELGAELTVDSAPGRGTTVKLVFSFLTT